MRSIGRTQKTSSLFLALGVAGVLASTAGVLHYSRIAVENLQKNGEIEIALTSPLRLTQLNWNLARSAEEDRVIAEEKIFAEAEVSRSIALLTPSLKKARLRTSRKFVRPEVIAVESPRIIAENNALDQIPEPAVAKSDEITLTASAAIPTAAIESQIADESSEMASPEEMLSIQFLHRQAQNQFLVAIQNLEKFVEESQMIAAPALTPDVPDTMTESEYAEMMELYLSQVDASSAVIVEDEIDSTSGAESFIPAQGEAKVASVVTESPVVTPPTAVIEVPSATPVELKVAAVDHITSDQAALNTQPPTPAEPKKTTIQISGLDGIPDEQEPAQTQPPTENSANLKSIEAPPQEKSSPKEHQPMLAARLVEPSEMLSTQLNTQKKNRDLSADDPTLDDNDYSFVDESVPVTQSIAVKSKLPALPKREVQQSQQTKPVVSIPSRPTPATSQVIARNDTSKQTPGVVQDPNGVTIQWNMSSPTRPLVSSVSPEIASIRVPDQKKFCDTALIGTVAFSTLRTEPLSVCRRALSFEGNADGTQAKWWEVRESMDHWPTLIYQKDREAFSSASRVPMLPTHAAKGLSILNKAKIQPNAGIVLGEVPVGFQVELSGRKDPLMYFDANYQQIEKADSARYFAYMNVAPGNPLLYLRLPSGTRGGSIPLIVRPGFVTYVKVPSPQAKTLSLRVFDSASAQPKPISALSVSVIGQSGRSGVTNSKGEVSLREVLVFGDYPLYVDVAPNENSFKHRYRLSPATLKNRDLFYFNEKTIARWIGQLEGGISSLSGMIVGAFPQLPMKSKQAYLRIQNLEKKAALTPETYTLGVADHLITMPRVDDSHRRFLSVQVPEGTQIPTALGEDGSVLWSEIVIAQPGVINVVSP